MHKVNSLKDVVTLISGRDLIKGQYNDNQKGIPYIMGASNMCEGNLKIERWTERPTVIGKKNDLIISVKGTVGELLILKEKEVHLSRQVMAIRPQNSDYSVRFIEYYIKFYLDKIKEKAKGMIPGITREDLLNIRFEKISLEKQNKIIELLDEAYAVVNKRKAQIEALDELVKSKFIEMFGNPISNSKGWDTKSLGDICELKAGKNIKAVDIFEEATGELYPCYGGNGLRGYVKSYSHEGDINLIGRQGALCGNVKFAKGKFYATEHAVVTQPKIEMNSYWLYFVLTELNLNKLATGAAQPGLTVGALNEVQVPVVNISLQNQFADFVKQVDKLKNEMEESLKELKDNFNSLMQKAFKGELF